MKLIWTGIENLYLIEPKVFEDQRGYFYESYNAKSYADNGLNFNFIQDNQSKSSFGVVRGLHFQLEPHAQTKLVRALEGRILDVVVDIRKGSKTYGKVYSVELSGENKLQLLVPKGFAHGFSVLSPTAVVSYKCDNLYHPASERGILFNDPSLSIDWKIPENEMVLSSKDKLYPTLENCDHNFKI